MSIDAVIAVVQGAGLDALEAGGISPTGTRRSPAEYLRDPAAGAQGLVVALRRGDDVVIIDSSMMFSLVAEALHGATPLGVVTASFGGTADSYAWQVDRRGVRRLRVDAQGETIRDVGDPLQDGPEPPVLTEDSLFELLARVTGFPAGDPRTAGLGDWADERGELLSWSLDGFGEETARDVPAGPATPLAAGTRSRARPWWRFWRR